MTNRRRLFLTLWFSLLAQILLDPRPPSVFPLTYARHGDDSTLAADAHYCSAFTAAVTPCSAAALLFCSLLLLSPTSLHLRLCVRIFRL